MAKISVIGDHVNDDGSVTTTTQTTVATFSTEKNHEGEFLGATTQVDVTRTQTTGGEPVTFLLGTTGPMSISQKDAVGLIGSRAFLDAQGAAVPAFERQFGHQAAQDVRHHPAGTAGVVIRSAALPVGVACVPCGIGMAIVGETLATVDSSKDRTPYP